MTVTSRIFIAWNLEADRRRKGSFLVRNGCVEALTVHRGKARVEAGTLEITGGAPAVIELALQLPQALYGENAPVVQWEASEDGFAFLPGSVPKKGRLNIPDFGVCIARSLAGLEHADPQGASYKDALNHGDFPKGREITWETWAARNQRQPDVPTVLGLSRDQRMFIVDPATDTITASLDLTFPTVGYVFARAITADTRCERRLEEGCLPILHSRQNCGSLFMEETLFASFVDRPLTDENLAGTPLKVSHLHCSSCTFPPGLREEAEREAIAALPKGELVLFLRSRVTNRGGIPLAAPLHLPKVFRINELNGGKPWETRNWVRVAAPLRLDAQGVAWSGETPFSLHRFNDAPPQSLQPCLLLEPGESMTVDSILSHRREGLSEAARQTEIPWDEKLAEAKAFWKGKLRPAATVSLPEERLSAFWKAGLLHLDLVTLGENRRGALLPKVGIYPPIGSESIPIVEFYDSLGLHDIARRCVDSFLELAGPDGRINLFSHYDIETGGALFMAGRHFAHTRDKAWASARREVLLRAADYLLARRQLENPEAPNYGLIAGTCADPVEATTSFMLNAYNGAGLLAVADMLEAIGDKAAASYRQAAGEFAARFRAAFARSFTQGPVMPTAPGRWAPTCAPWVEGIGLHILGLKGEAGFTHRAYAVFDALLGPLYGVFAGLADPHGRHAQWLLEVNHAQLNRACVSESQPYYGRHPEIHLLRGEREPFLNAFYSGLTSLADRDTFTFWEHFYQLTPHKTHEEGWALMQLRRMLWLEDGRELRLLAGIPEAWLDPGKAIGIEGGGSYFGKLSFRVERSEEGRFVDLRWEPEFHTPPESVRLHLPGLSVGGSPEARLRIHSGEWVEIADPAKALTARVELII